MKLLRSLVFIVIMSKAVIFSGLFCGEFSEKEIVEGERAKSPLSSCVLAKACKSLDSLSNSLIAVYRPCQKLNQLFIILVTDKGTKYSWLDASRLITHCHVLPLIAGVEKNEMNSSVEEKRKFTISREATRNLAKYWEDAEVEQEDNCAFSLSISIPADSSVSRRRGNSTDWFIGCSPPTSPIFVH